LPEHLSNQSLSSIPLDGAPQFFRRDDAEPRRCAPIWEQEQRYEAAVKARPSLEDQLKLGPPSDALCLREPLGGL